MMSFENEETRALLFASASTYTLPEVEWQALLTLAAAPNPAELIASGRWTAALFGCEEALQAFHELAERRASQLLSKASSLEEPRLVPYADQAALLAARERLAQFAQLRTMETIQRNLAREMRSLVASKHTEGVGKLLETALTAFQSVKTLDTPAAHKEMATLGELLDSYWDRITEQRHAAPTGLGDLDRAFGGGLQAGRLFVLLGGPGSGKTTLANQIAEHIASGGRPVVYLTKEDPLSTLLAKSIARVGDIDYGDVLQGQMSEQQTIDETRSVLAQRASAQRLLYIEGHGSGLDELPTLAQHHFARYADEAQGGGPGVLVVDYLQRVARAQLSVARGKVRDLREAVTLVTEQLRDLAEDLNCTVLAIASQNRASGYGNANALSSAKESGDIEYTADVLLSLAEDKSRVAPKFCEARLLSVAKNRLGSQTEIALDWQATRQQFTVAEKVEQR